MSDISTKLTYLNETKSQLKNMINYGLPSEEQITSSTTFRNYVSSIFNAFLEALRTPDTLFTNLPKKSGTGANITLNDTANAPMRIELGATELSQAGTPTPDSPQDIHTISGSNKVVVCGKNLFDYNDLAQTISNFTISGNETNFTITRINTSTEDYYLDLPSGISYTFSGEWSTTYGNGAISVIYDDGTRAFFLMSNYSTSSANGTISQTTDASKKISHIHIEEYNGGNFTLKNFMISTTTSQEANIDLGDIEYCKIGNYEDKFIRTSGKNLFNKDNANILNAYLTVSQNNILSSANDRIVWIPCKPNTTYTISKLLQTTDNRLSIATTIEEPAIGVQKYNQINSYSTSTYTYTTDSNANYLVIFCWTTTSNNTLEEVLNSIMINEGTTALPYEPYGTDEWYIGNRLQKIVLDGTQGTYYDKANRTNTTRFLIQNAITNDIGANDNSCKSNYFIRSANIYSADIEGFYLANSHIIYLSVNNSIATTVSDFKAWLSTHNVEIWYIAQTPTYTKITGTLANQLEYVYQKLLSYTGQTNISQVNNDLPFVINASALEDLEV